MNKEKIYLMRKPGTDEWVEITEEDLESITLENGRGIPATHGDYTAINHYIGTFWSHFLGPRNFMVLFQIIKHAYGDKNHSYPSIQLLCYECGISSKNTVRDAIKALEKLGFVVTVKTIDTERNENDNNIYFIRRTTPYISLEQYSSLPEMLQREHDKYMQKLVKSGSIQMQDVPEYKRKEKKGGSKNNPPGSKIEPPQKGSAKIEPPSSENELLPKNEPEVAQILNHPSSNYEPGVAQKLHPNNININNNNGISINNNKEHHLYEEINGFLQLQMKSILQKQSYETWIKPIRIVEVKGEHAVIAAPNQFAKEWIESRYLDKFKMIFSQSPFPLTSFKLIISD